MPQQPAAATQEPIKVVVDHRESTSGIPAMLVTLGAEIESTHLDVGDYFLGPDLIVERKEAKDFIASILDRRYDYQAQHLVSASVRSPIYVIEGDLYAEHGYGLDEEQRQWAVSFLIACRGISILQTRNRRETASLLFKMATHTQRGAKDPTWHGKKPKGKTVLEQQYLVEALPKVGHTLAKRLLEEFGSPMRIFAAATEELTKVRGVGPMLASHIRRVLQGEGEPPEVGK